MNYKAKKIVFIFVCLVIVGGIYAGIISMCDRYLQENGLLNPFSKAALLFVLGFGLYKIYRQFCRRLNSAANK